MTPLTRALLGEHLVAHRIAGDVATSRVSNHANIEKMLARQPEYWFGLELDRAWTADDVLKVLAARVGIDPDPERTTGSDRIDPQLCLDALDAAGELVAATARTRGRVLLATGHPTGVLALHLPLAAGLAAAGCEVMAAADGDWVEVIGDRRRIRYLGGRAPGGAGGGPHPDPISRRRRHGRDRWRPHAHPFPGADAAPARDAPDAAGPRHRGPWLGGRGRPGPPPDHAPGPASRRSAWPTPTTPHCSSARRRARSPSWSRWTTTSCRWPTPRWRRTC